MMDTTKTDAINKAIAEWFANNPATDKIPAMDLMPFFIQKHIFNKDPNGGKPIRDILRNLDKDGELQLIPAAHPERKDKNTNWYFVRPGEAMAVASTKAVQRATIAPEPAAILHASFAPVVNAKSKILILGSLPGAVSLAKGEYYGNSNNHFWKIMDALLGNMPQDYENRCAWLLRNGVALWDVIATANRKGSLDTSIKNDVANDFVSFYQKYTGIHTICFNGTKAKTAYEKSVEKQTNHRYILLPSSSSARAMRADEKVKQWAQLLTT